MYEIEFCKRLSQLRTKRGVSAREMSLALGQNPNYINHIENGQSLPSMSVFFYICEYLKITPQEFYDFDNLYPNIHRNITENLKKLSLKEIESIDYIIRSMVKS